MNRLGDTRRAQGYGDSWQSASRFAPPDAPKAMAFRFFRTADVHLDSPLAALALPDAILADPIGGATGKASAEASG